jgi:DNA-binding MarR family transcriptional regulator
MKDADALVDALVQTSFDTSAALTRLAAENDLTLPQLRLLGILRDRRARMTELASHLGLEKSSLSGLVERAEKRGLVVREPSSTDGRAIEVLLTPSGQAVADRLTGRAHERVLPLVDALSAAEKRELASLLRKALESRSP